MSDSEFVLVRRSDLETYIDWETVCDGGSCCETLRSLRAALAADQTDDVARTILGATFYDSPVDGQRVFKWAEGRIIPGRDAYIDRMPTVVARAVLGIAQPTAAERLPGTRQGSSRSLGVRGD